MPAHRIRIGLGARVALGLCLAGPALSDRPPSFEPSAAEKKRECIAAIKRPDKEMRNRSGETMRDFYVARLGELDSSVLDAQVADLVSDLIEKDENEWVRLEAAAVISRIPLPRDRVRKAIGRLEKCRKDPRVNFQVLASESLARIGRKLGKPNAQAERTLADIAQGRDMGNWKVMIPPHNVGMLVEDPGSKSKIPYEESYKTTLRTKAIHALAESNDGFSREVISGLTEDRNPMVKQIAQAYAAAPVPAPVPAPGR